MKVQIGFEVCRWKDKFVGGQVLIISEMQNGKTEQLVFLLEKAMKFNF